jgi:hypothetical protein
MCYHEIVSAHHIKPFFHCCLFVWLVGWWLTLHNLRVSVFYRKLPLFRFSCVWLIVKFVIFVWSLFLMYTGFETNFPFTLWHELLRVITRDKIKFPFNNLLCVHKSKFTCDIQVKRAAVFFLVIFQVMKLLLFSDLVFFTVFLEWLIIFKIIWINYPNEKISGVNTRYDWSSMHTHSEYLCASTPFSIET